MKAYLTQTWQLIAALGLVGLAGCSVVPAPQADLTRYYVLGDTVAVSETADIGSGLVVGLANVRLPAYLDKGAIVVRQAENELIYNDYARWAEPLAESIGRVVRGRLLASPRVARVFTEGFPFDRQRDCDVTVSIQRCEGVDIGGRVSANFAAVIEITTPSADGGVIARKVFMAPATNWDGRDYGALVQLISQAVATLGDEIVATLPTP